MERYHVAAITLVASACAFVEGWSRGIPASAPVLTYELRLQATAAQPIGAVRARYSALQFGTDPTGVLIIDYVSDRIFCDGMQGNQLCWQVRP